ncbi:hypothetical protein M408DRAFT_334231 [Serendipita vermifera MAFF 305830]|uniref:Uncharacterized protein n=1 Tax=Serendipita vermifera MAFF 305830 TaxID=933852 RepID=A0A0C3AKP9_SERVB|nr:hypothetical protein M408DRAFT_334231 [Serendipita vermifera MAFF 305830]
MDVSVARLLTQFFLEVSKLYPAFYEGIVGVFTRIMKTSGVRESHVRLLETQDRVKAYLREVQNICTENAIDISHLDTEAEEPAAEGVNSLETPGMDIDGDTTLVNPVMTGLDEAEDKGPEAEGVVNSFLPGEDSAGAAAADRGNQRPNGPSTNHGYRVIVHLLDEADARTVAMLGTILRGTVEFEAIN